MQKVIISGYAAPSINRTEYFYGAYSTLEAGKPAIEFDRYQMSTGPTIAGQIDSMDDIAATGWYANTGIISQDTVDFIEGQDRSSLMPEQVVVMR